MPASGTVSTVNSSTTPLAANGAFTGTSEDVSGVAVVMVSVLADQASAGGGLSLQFSSDGVHWDVALAVTIAANTGAAFPVCPLAKFFRVVYTNGTTLQGAFRLQTVYHAAGTSLAAAAFADQNAALPPAVVEQRVLAEMGVLSAASNAVNRVRSAGDAVVGIAGSTAPAMAPLVYDGTKFWPHMGTQSGGGYVQGPAAAGAAVAGNPVRIGISDGTDVQDWKQTGSAGLMVTTAAGVPLVQMGLCGLGSNQVNQWGTAASQGDDSGGTFYPAVSLYSFNGTTFDRPRNPVVTKTIAAVAVTAGAPVAIWTPATSKKFRVMGYALSLSVAGSVILKDATTEILRTPLMAAGIGQPCPPGMGNGILSAAANNVLNADVSASGSVSGFIYGTEE